MLTTQRLALILAACLLAPASFAGGYNTSVDVYLDLEGPWTNDLRFDYSSAINQPDLDEDGECDHRRDFIFSCGWYDDSDATGSGARFVCSASNNAPGWPKNPGRSPATIDESGWYTFEHVFRDDGLGVLAVDLNILDAGGALVATWTLSDPTDVIGSTVGGNRYGWFVTSDFDWLAVDNSSLCTSLSCDFEQGFEVDTDGWFTLTAVASGTHGIDSAAGDGHAELAPTDFGSPDGFVFTRWGGYGCEFGAGGVSIDLRPNNEQNQVNTGSRQLVPVAILSTESWDACDPLTGVDEFSVLARGASPSTSRTRCEDADGDGLTDMVLYFRARSLDDPSEEECADPEAIFSLTGATLDGTSFQGSDSVTWLGCD